MQPERYGSRNAFLGTVAMFALLFCFAGYTFIDAAYLTSTCPVPNGMDTCPANGPDWARPLPSLAVLSGLLAGLAACLVGRRVRTPALITGFLLVTAGLVVSRLMSPRM
ncbi:hypothetical protein Q0Z83_030760 [Actinoplanes sichuanensis]|uniref:Vitamin K epoxide reductase family protein n=1 Tax=Actinoplanes sichuanensis TaxID=512349 RepID=A0ABW4ARF3_9ACTN|nr:hypothetical protein [Actinoplanes sichuanensis]BEL04885.1 hypothetical protein Q0Z83_030760 [Actinoplanes sichuanensis]